MHHRLPTLIVFLAVAGGGSAPLCDREHRLLSAGGHRLPGRGDADLAGFLDSPGRAAKIDEVGRVLGQDPGVAGLRRVRRQRRHQPGQSVHRSSSPRTAAATLPPTRSSRGCGPSWRRSSARRRSCRRRRTSTSAAARARRNINIRCPITDLTSSTAGRPSCSPRCRRCPRLKDVSSDQQSKAGSLNLDHRPRCRGALRHHPDADRHRGLRDARPGRGRAIFHAAEQLSRRRRGAARRCRIARHPEFALPAVADDRQDACRCRCSSRRPAGHQQADGQPPGRISGRDAVVQPGAGRRAQPGDQGGAAGARQAGRARRADRRVPGQCAGVPAIAVDRAGADRSRR